MIRRTLREWEKLHHGDGPDQIPIRIADRLAAVAATLPLAAGGDGILVQGRHFLQAQGVVGIVVSDDACLEILPKIDIPGDHDALSRDASIRRRLVHMLAVALDLEIDVGPATELEMQQETLLEILIKVFCEKLTEAVRRGMPRRYVEHTDDLPSLRGKLQIARQFTQHSANPGRLACRFDELSEDITLNRVMKAVINHLFRISRNPANQSRLRELHFLYAEVTDVSAAALRFDEIILDRTNSRWRELLSLAKLFLNNRYQSTTGGNTRGMALLFEMSGLFEEYIGRLIVRAAAGSDFSVSLQGGRLHCLTTTDDNRGLFQTKPDILIRRSGRVVHIIDTKWKRISPHIQDRKQGVSQADVYQMMAYGQLYSAARLTLLYPHHAGLGDAENVFVRHRVTGNDAFLETASIDVGIGSGVVKRLQSLLSLEMLA